jgi:glycerol-3-phosphate dehydrogenase
VKASAAVDGAGAGVSSRATAWLRLQATREWDLVVVGGGATGLSVALDAALRGFSVALFEAEDFAKGTSSRATKLLHGGVRYLAQGDVSLVREALHERAAWMANAPQVAQPLAFVVPTYRRRDLPFYGAGLKAYEWLAGRRSLGRTAWLDVAQAQAALPGVRRSGLRGGVRYWDGQFDDARLAVLLARAARQAGACVLNHVRVGGLRPAPDAPAGGRLTEVEVSDALDGACATVRARCVVNATGVWVDALRNMDRAREGRAAAPLVQPSQGVHLVVDRAFLPGQEALLVPRTQDGRVLFAVPWLGKIVLGTTDTPRQEALLEPRPLAQEVAFILHEAAQVLERAPQRSDVRSAWVGLRPLVRPQPAEGSTADGGAGAGAGATQALSREHTIEVSPSGLVTVTGGKWTTARAMAEDVLSQCMQHGLLPHRPAGATERHQLPGAAPGRSLTLPPGEHLYGLEAQDLRALPGADRWLAHDAETGAGVLSEAMVRFAARQEMACSVEDVLARRSRLLFLDARQAQAVADQVGQILAQELGDDFDAQASVRAFVALADQYATCP